MHRSLLALLLSFTLSTNATEVQNVLFLISDDLKASVLGCYGDEVCQTPNIDRLAERGMVFDRAYCQGTACAPSRTSFMWSRYLGGGKGNAVNWGQNFRENGYYSARVGKIYHMRVPGDTVGGTDGNDIASTWTERFNMPGLEAHTPGDYACLNLNIFTKRVSGRESTKDKNRMFVTVAYEGDGSDQPDYKAATKTIELLGQKKDEHFFLAVGFVRPHYPMVAPQQYFDPYPWQDIELPLVPEGDLDDIPRAGIASTRNGANPIGDHPDNQKRMWQAYYASTQFMDDQVGRILDTLEAEGLADSTAVVFTSDHGYHLGEHTFWQKSNLHEEVLRVPLIIDVPGLPSGRSDSLVELLDLYPTLSSIVGLQVPAEAQGKDLTPILHDPSAQVRDAALSLHGSSNFALRSPRWAYVRYANGDEELYDMDNDPEQFTNLAYSPEHDPVRKNRAAALKKRLKEAGLSAASKPPPQTSN